MQTQAQTEKCWSEESRSDSFIPFTQASHKHSRRHCSASTETNSPPRTRSWKAYWTRSSKQSRPPASPVFRKRRKMEPVEGDDASIWSPQIEHTFVQLLVDLVNNGRIVNGSVNINMWSSIADKMSELTGRTYTATQCRTKFSRLRMSHREFSDLLHHRTGFGWDPVSNTVQGTETQWQQYLRINKKAGRFRRKGCPNYELLGLIFNGSTATGVLRHSSARTPPDSDEENDLNDALLRFGMHVSVGGNASVGNGTENVGGSGAGLGIGGGNVAPTSRGIVFREVGEVVGPAQGVVIGGNGRGKRPIDSSCPSSENKRKGKGKESSSSMDSLRSDALKEFRDLVSLRKEMLIQDQQRRSSGGEASGGGASSGVSFSNSMSRALGLLDEVAPDLDDEKYLKAFNLLKDENTRDGFIAMAPARKKAWVASL